jgi:bacillithiol biosynthesis cysteine-adding enzyme BshC
LTGVSANHPGGLIFNLNMDCISTRIPYGQTGFFSKIIIDYLDQSQALQPYYKHPVSVAGIEASIKSRQSFSTDRPTLVKFLEQQYAVVEANAAVKENISKLSKETTFTICTAHQPAIFTGNLYFIYKIIHVIRLAGTFKKQWPQYDFVPVFWMGSEDADLDELGKIYLGGEKIVWDTKQTGAVGRMNTKGLSALINRIEGELSVQPFGKELIDLIKKCYLESPDLQTATFKLLHALFADRGLIVMIPDDASLKRLMQPVFEDDLFQQKPSAIVEKTIEKLSADYKVQANPRSINLFYLKEDLRELIEKNDEYRVRNSNIRFTADQLKKELNDFPERFSPNVILRGLFQETVLPNIAFIGGGGETAYWLELKDLFEHYKVPFPVLILRNSFLVVEKKWQEKINKMALTVQEFFEPEQQLLSTIVSRQKNGELKLQQEMEAASKVFQLLKSKAAAVDQSLLQHVEALQVKTLKPLQELEKKLLRAEKKKFEAEQRQIQQIKSALFPNDGLQERIDNFMPYFALWGKSFFECIYKNSLTLEQEFVILDES